MPGAPVIPPGTSFHAPVSTQVYSQPYQPTGASAPATSGHPSGDAEQQRPFELPQRYQPSPRQELQSVVPVPPHLPPHVAGAAGFRGTATRVAGHS